MRREHWQLAPEMYSRQNPAGVIRRDWCGLIVHLF